MPPRPSVLRRGSVVLGAAVAAALAAVLAGPTAGCRTDLPSVPNVLLVVMDTTRADRCSLLGHDRPTTPRLEVFARDAVVYEDCWSPSSWTAPAHASLFTGLLPRNHGLHNGRTLHLDDERTTMAELLRDGGWRTGCFTNNPFVSPDYGLTQGFETTDLRFTDDARPYPWAPATNDAVLAWIDRAAGDGRPFFAFVNDMEPHAPYSPPAAAGARFLPADLPPWAAARARSLAFPETLGIGLGHVPLEPESARAMRALYDAEIATVDDAVGALLDGLRSRGLLDRTLVVVTSDHGEGLGDHGWIEHATYLWRELLRVPLVLRLPSAYDGGRRVKEVVRLEDVLPTVLDVCGLAPPAGLDGVPLSRELPGRVALGSENPASSMVETARGLYPGIDASPLAGNRRSVYDGRWHLVVSEGGKPLLFDVTADPAEERDVASDHPGEVERLSGHLRQIPFR